MRARQISAGVWQLPLPSNTLPPFDSTNCYIVADGGVGTIIDPGSDETQAMESLARILTVAAVDTVKGVLLTHAHADHLAGVDEVRKRFGSPPVYLHPSELYRPGFASDGRLALSGGRVITVGNLYLRAHHTPGHTPGHLCLELPDRGVLFTGDLISGSGSVWVGVPEGDVRDYLASLERMKALKGLELLGPGHGDAVSDPYRRIGEVTEHRLAREQQIVDALRVPATLSELRDRIYPGLQAGLTRAAEATLLAHLAKLMAELRVSHLGEDESGPFQSRA